MAGEEAGVVTGNEVLVADDVGKGGRGQVCAVCQDHDAANGLHRGDQLFDGGEKGQVDEEQLVFGVVYDVGDLVRLQARVNSVQNRALSRHTIVKLEVSVSIPGNCANPIANADSGFSQSISQLLASFSCFDVGVPGKMLNYYRA